MVEWNPRSENPDLGHPVFVFDYSKLGYRRQ